MYIQTEDTDDNVLENVNLSKYKKELIHTTNKNIDYFFSDFRGVITRAGPMRPRMRATADAVVIEPEDVCKMPPVTPHERACLAFMPKWTFDFR